MPMFKVVVECSGAVGDAVLTYRNVPATSSSVAAFRACQKAGEHYPEYTDIRATRVEAKGYDR